MDNEKNYNVADFSKIKPVSWPCGKTQRAFIQDRDLTATFHIVEISQTSRKHYHKKMNEIYYVLK